MASSAAVPTGHGVVNEAEVPAGASVEVIEDVSSPALADGWVAPGSGVTLVQPRVEISGPSPSEPIS
ncbi:hypothetical protein ACTXJ3_06805 [Brachybacterium paraconglomeratum]|uniref:hypothetical protein n=1 Tax=Brachybacterium paraconglomeratum TaxID=173362 RepID=UPI003FCFA6D9